MTIRHLIWVSLLLALPLLTAAPAPVPRKESRPSGVFVRSQSNGTIKVTLTKGGKYECWWFGQHYSGEWSWDAEGEVVMVIERKDGEQYPARNSYRAIRVGNTYTLEGYTKER